ncbi:MAG TPA: group 1 glycosyl transferase, partial [Nitrospiraceae bacterium]|nr:group 1 glycosyl transferase [Nitrospiraceae bacterium]
MKLLNLGCGSHHHPAWTNVDFVSSGDDVMPYDLNAGIPFEDGSFDAIYHSHLLEHLPRAYVPVFLKECNRVLKRGGTIRVAVPDLEQIVRIYLNELERSLDGDTESMQRYEWIILELLDQMVRNKPGGDMIRYWEQCPMPGESFVKQRMGAQLSNALHNISKRKNGNRNGANPLDNPPAQQIGEFRLSGEIHQWMYDRYSLGKLLREAGFRDIGTCRADESGIPAFNSYLLDIGPDGSVRKPDSLFMEATKTRFAPEKEKKNESDNRLDQLLHERVEASDLTAGTIANANMLNVLHLSTMDHAGAGNAAYRLHNGLRSV